MPRPDPTTIAPKVVARGLTDAPALPPKRAVIYLRVSTTRQAETDFDPEGLSLPSQREACMRRAAELGAEVVDEYVDRGDSAKTMNRPMFQQMLSRISECRDIDYVILDKIDRFARNRRDDANILYTLHLAGAQLISVKENIDSTPAGKLMHGILATLAEYYSANLATEAIKGMTRKAEVGGTPTQAPIGYRNVREVLPGLPRGIASVAIDPERAPFVQWAFDAYATGDWSTQALTDELARRGLRSVPTLKRPAKPLHKSRVAVMLSNPYYIGIVSFRGVQYEGRHEPIIDRQVFDRVQDVLRLKSTSGEKTQRHHHPLKGTVYCGLCGSRLIFTRHTGHGGTYDYFRCMSRSGRNPCDLGYVRTDWLEAAVEERWRHIQLDETTATELTAMLVAEIGNQNQAGAAERQRLTKRLRDLDTERENLLRAHLADAVPLDLLKREQDRIGRAMRDAQSILDSTEIELQVVEATLTQALDLATRCYDSYRMASAPVRRALNQAFFERIDVLPDDVVVYMRSPFKEIDTAVGMSDPNAQRVSIVLPDFRFRDAEELCSIPSKPVVRRYFRLTGSNMIELVGDTGFEPVTSRM